MYTLVIILLALVLFFGILGLRKKWRETERLRVKKRQEGERWVDSQPPEVIVSGRKRAAEKARAFLQEQLNYDYETTQALISAFIEEFGASQDPEIQELVEIIWANEGEEPDFLINNPCLIRQISILENSKMGP